jgi:selenocysteine lyase/cysteine desulfurase
MFPVDVRADDVDSMCSGTYKWLLGGFGVAPFYLKKSLFDKVPSDRFGIFQVQSQTPDFHFVLRNTARRYNYATLPFAEVHQLGGRTRVSRQGWRREDRSAHPRPHAPSREGTARQGHKLFTPDGNRSSVLCFYTKKPAADVRKAFEDAKVDVSVRDDHVRVSIALFNNSDDVDAALDVAMRLT